MEYLTTSLVPCRINLLLICWSEESKRLPKQSKLLTFPVLPTERKGKSLLLKMPCALGLGTWRNGAGADWNLLPKEVPTDGKVLCKWPRDEQSVALTGCKVRGPQQQPVKTATMLPEWHFILEMTNNCLIGLKGRP